MPVNRYRALLLMNVFSASLPYYFVSLLLLRQLGFSYTVIGTLSVVTELFGTVFDLPLSICAQKFGYQRLLILSHLFLLVGLGALMNGKLVFAFLAAVFMGLSESLSSGTLVSFNFDVLANEKEYAKFLKNSNTIKYVFIALVTIISPFLLKQSVLYPLILSISFVMISLICLLKLPNKIVKSDSKEASALLSGIRLAPWQLMVLGVSFTTLIMVNNSYASLLLTDKGISLDVLGIILFLFNLGMALGSYLKIEWKYTLVIPILVVLISMQTEVHLIILLFLLIRILNANYNNQLMLKMNQTIKENRAVAWSLYNFAISISFMLADFLAGLIADRFGLLMVYRVFGLSATFYLIYYCWKKRK